MPVQSATHAHHLSLPPIRFIRIMHKIGELALRIGELIRSLFQKILPALFNKTSPSAGVGRVVSQLKPELQPLPPDGPPSSSESFNSLPELIYNQERGRGRSHSLERPLLVPPSIGRLPSTDTYSNLPGLLFSHVPASENPLQESQSLGSSTDLLVSHSRGLSDISMSSANVQIIMAKARMLAAAKNGNSLDSQTSVSIGDDYKRNGTASSEENFHLLGRLPSPQNSPPPSATFYVCNEMGTQHLDLTKNTPPLDQVAASPPKSARARKKKIDLLARRKKCEDFEPLHIVGSKGLQLQDLSKGIYCALKGIECLWSRIQVIKDLNIQPEDLEKILDEGISLCNQKGDQFEKPEDLLVHFPSIQEVLFSDGISKGPKYPTQLKENGIIYGNTYKNRVLIEIERIYSIGDKNPQHLAAALFLKGHKGAQEAFVIFAYLPPESAHRYYLLDFGAAVEKNVSLQCFQLRANLRDHLVARVPVSIDDQENDLYQFIPVKVV